MEASWIAERSMLRHLLALHPTWSSAEVARCLGRSLSWVKKWRKRFHKAAPDDQQVLRSRSRARHTPPPSTPPEVVQRLLDLRDQPPENLQRVPGPRALLYYLPRHTEGLLKARSSAPLHQDDLEDSAPAWPHRRGSPAQVQATGATRPDAGNSARFQG